MRRKRTSHRIDWEAVCEDAARRHSRRQDRVILAILFGFGVVALIAYYITTSV